MAERLIDAEALLKEDFTDCFIDDRDAKVFEDIIERTPTIEAKPVVHAHWEKYDDSEYCYCSNCGEPGAEDSDVEWHGYCPICGAQMDEKESDINVGSKGVKIPVISMEDVPKLAKEMEK